MSAKHHHKRKKKGMPQLGAKNQPDTDGVGWYVIGFLSFDYTNEVILSIDIEEKQRTIFIWNGELH